jgi:hypothetical protein
MTIASILDELDAEIARLQEVKNLLSSASRTTADGNSTVAKPVRPKKRTLSAEARKKIAEAQRKRWAAQKAKK